MLELVIEWARNISVGGLIIGLLITYFLALAELSATVPMNKGGVKPGRDFDLIMKFFKYKSSCPKAWKHFTLSIKLGTSALASFLLFEMILLFLS